MSINIIVIMFEGVSRLLSFASGGRQINRVEASWSTFLDDVPSSSIWAGTAPTLELEIDTGSIGGDISECDVGNDMQRVF